MNQDDQDIELQGYQDDLDTSDSKSDAIINEETDDPTEGFGVPPEEFRQEMDKLEIDDVGNGDEDQREMIEDYDEEMGPGGKGY